MSISAGLLVPKNSEDVTSRILSPPYHGGVWDELLSVEDPADFDRHYFPDALLVDPKVMLSRKLVAPNVSPSGLPTPVFKDLASKVSAATWLVYQYELRRADVMIKKYIKGLGEFCHGLNKDELKNEPSNGEEAKLFDDHISRLSEMFVTLFEENSESRYRVPASIPSDARANDCLYLVLLGGKLLILRVTKICADQDGWWSSEFLSRRDIR